LWITFSAIARLAWPTAVPAAAGIARQSLIRLTPGHMAHRIKTAHALYRFEAINADANRGAAPSSFVSE